MVKTVFSCGLLILWSMSAGLPQAAGAEEASFAAVRKPSTDVAPQSDLYQETYRPQFHVTARQWTVHKLNPGQREEGWINDINGLIHHKGQYHLCAVRRGVGCTS